MTFPIPPSAIIAAVVVLVVVGLAVIAALVLRMKMANTSKADADDVPAAADVGLYVRRPYLLTPAEYSYYKVLHQVLDPAHIVLVKVRLADLFDVKDGLEKGQRQSAVNRITRKHLDFILCDRTTCVPLLAIELDDASHGREDRKTRDQFVDGLCRSSGLPLVRQPAQRGYSLDEVRRALATALPTGAASRTT